MLKRADLAKQFELVVQQEITNYQNSLNQILDTLRSLQDQIKEIKKSQFETVASIASKQQQIESSLKQLNAKHADHVQLADNRFHNQFVVNVEQDMKLQALKVAVDAKIHSDSYHKEILNEVNNRISSCEKVYKNSNQAMQAQVDDLLALFRKEIESAKKDILSRPSDALAMKAHLEDKLSSHKVDVDGLLKEIRINRKDMMIIEKKIENIYTQIERLKKSGGVL